MQKQQLSDEYKNSRRKTGIAYIDITTGEFKVTEIENDKECSGMMNELNKNRA